jgi:hypothetical protein
VTGFNSKRAQARDKLQGNEMSMSDLDWEIQELYIEGFSAKTIAVMLACDIEIVLGKIAAMGVADSQQDDEVYSPYHG